MGLSEFRTLAQWICYLILSGSPQLSVLSHRPSTAVGPHRVSHETPTDACVAGRLWGKEGS